MTEDERVREKEGISSLLGDEKSEGNRREEEEVAMVMTEEDTNRSLILLLFPLLKRNFLSKIRYLPSDKVTPTLKKITCQKVQNYR